MTTIAVAGGTGALGAQVVEAVRRRNLAPVVIARSHGVDLTTGAGLDDVLDGVDAVIDASNVAALRAKSAITFFEAATGHLLAAGERVGVRHHVAVSIVGCDRVDMGYYVGKRRQEELVRSGPVPWTIVRATQFHEFAGQVMDRTPGPVKLVPQMLSQPVSARELADLLVDTAVGDPAGVAPDVGGPEQHQIPDLARRLVAHRGQRTKVIAAPLPGKVGRQIADGRAAARCRRDDPARDLRRVVGRRSRLANPAVDLPVPHLDLTRRPRARVVPQVGEHVVAAPQHDVAVVPAQVGVEQGGGVGVGVLVEQLPHLGRPGPAARGGRAASPARTSARRR